LFSAEEHPANLAYTRYVLDAGHSGDFLDLMAALAPCVFGYGEIGAKLLGGQQDTPYSSWIETYGGSDYQQLCDDLGSLIDDAVRRRLGDTPTAGPRWQALCHRFKTATRLEVGFWQIGLEV
jgi:thiaminase/transcriptional activator TenA